MKDILMDIVDNIGKDLDNIQQRLPDNPAFLALAVIRAAIAKAVYDRCVKDDDGFSVDEKGRGLYKGKIIGYVSED